MCITRNLRAWEGRQEEEKSFQLLLPKSSFQHGKSPFLPSFRNVTISIHLRFLHPTPSAHFGQAHRSSLCALSCSRSWNDLEPSYLYRTVGSRGTRQKESLSRSCPFASQQILWFPRESAWIPLKIWGFVKIIGPSTPSSPHSSVVTNLKILSTAHAIKPRRQAVRD